MTMKIILFLGLLSFGLAAQSQIVVRKVYGYKQANIPGARPVSDIERAIPNNYYIFIETSKKETIKVNELWILGKRYALKTGLVPKTPVRKTIYTGSMDPDTVLLVPRSAHKVISVMPGVQAKTSSRIPENVAAMLLKYDVVIGYEWNGKKYYTWLRSLQTLQPEAHQ